MKTIEDFKGFYQSSLKDELSTLEKIRKETIRIFWRNRLYYLLISAGLIGVSLLVNLMIYDVLMPDNFESIPFIVAFVLIVAGIFILISFNQKQKKKFTDQFKEQIIKLIVSFIHPELTYQKEGMVSINDFVASNLFLHYPDRYSGDDLVKGKIGKTDIEFSEIHASYKQKGDESKKDKIVKLFDGLFFKADFHKDFKGHHYVMPDFAEKKFGSVGKFFQKLNRSHGKLIHLEDPEFEKEFAVYGTDEVESRYILSMSMMKRILDFKIRTNKNIFIGFVNSCIFIAIPYKNELFEPKIYGTMIDEENTTGYFLDMNLAISIVEELNLNTRIWSKE